MLPKDITRGEQTVQGSRKSRVNGHLHNDLHNFLSRAAHMQGGRDMHPELRSRIAQCGQRRHRRYFPIFQIKSGPGVNVSKGKLHKITGKVRRDVPQTFHHSFTTLSVHLTQHFEGRDDVADTLVRELATAFPAHRKSGLNGLGAKT